MTCEDHTWTWGEEPLTCECFYCEAKSVMVPGKGEFFVRDGNVIEVIESELMEPGTKDWAWRVWTDPQGDDE